MNPPFEFSENVQKKFKNVNKISFFFKNPPLEKILDPLLTASETFKNLKSSFLYFCGIKMITFLKKNEYKVSGELIRLRNCSKFVERSLFAIIDLLQGTKTILLYFIWRVEG